VGERQMFPVHTIRIFMAAFCPAPALPQASRGI